MLRFTHALRADMRVIASGIGDLLAEQAPGSDVRRQRLEKMRAALQRQEELIAAAVDYEQAREKADIPDPPIPLKLAIQTACRAVESVRRTEGGSLHVSWPDQTASPVTASLAKAIEKVLLNALRFHRPGEPPEIRLEMQEPTPGAMTLCISDRGLGIEPAYREHVFEPFVRLHPPHSFPGSGLGLSIARELLARIGGTITLEGNPDPPAGERGTIAVISFPLAP